MTRRFLIIGSFAAIYLLWGSTYFAIALGLQSMPPFMLMGIRSLCGGLILIGLGGRDAIDASGRTWLNAGLCGLLFFVGCHGILALAQQRAPSGIAAIVLATIPFWIVLIDFLMPHDARPDPRTLITLVPGFAGVTIVAWQNIDRNGVGTLPILLLLVAALSWSAGTTLSRRTSSGGSSISISGMQLSLGGIMLFLISWSSGEMHHFSPNAVSMVSLDLPDRGRKRCRFCGLSLAARQCADPTGFNLHLCKPGHRRAVGDGLPWRTALSRHAFRRLSCYRFHYCDVAYRTFSLAVTCQRKAIGDQTAFDAQGLLDGEGHDY